MNNDSILKRCNPIKLEQMNKNQQTAWKGIKTIGARCFFKNNSLKTLKIGDEVEIVESFAFANCENLETIIMGNNVKSIGINAFFGCKKLKKVVLSNKIITIPKNCFRNCCSLESITMPASIENIDINAFMYCHKLKYFYANNNLQFIHSKAFCSCESLKEFHTIKGFTNFQLDAFNGISSSAKFIYKGPQGAYKPTNILKLVKELTSIHNTMKFDTLNKGIKNLKVLKKIENAKARFKEIKSIKPDIKEYD